MTDKTAETMNLVFATDEKFINHMCVTIASLLKSADINSKFKIYILTNTQLDETKILKLKKLHDFDFEIIKIDENDFDKCPTKLHLTKATYYRLKLPSLINDDKVLYLDGDILVRKDLKNFYNKDISDVYAAAHTDFCWLNDIINVKIETANYFNAGVLLLNLKKMREDDIEAKCFEFINEHIDMISWVDQCVLNEMFKAKKLQFENIYNFQYSKYYAKTIEPMYKKMKNDIAIIHFITDLKPWNFEAPLKFVFEYYKYFCMTNSIVDLFKAIFKAVSHSVEKFKNEHRLRKMFNGIRGLYS